MDPDFDEVGGGRFHIPPLCLLLTTLGIFPGLLVGMIGGRTGGEIAVVDILLPSSWGRAAEGAGGC